MHVLKSLDIDTWVAIRMHDEIILAVKDEQVEEAKQQATAVFNQLEPGFIADNLTIKSCRSWLEVSK